MRIDLNADLGESFGAYQIGEDAALLQIISSANVACGVHAGDALTIWRTLKACQAHGVRVGAHVGHRDRYGFGRREISIGAEEAYAETLYQIGSLRAMLRVLGEPLHHVKPHGALYNQMVREETLCRAVARATKDFSHTLRLVVLAGSAAAAWARDEGCVVVEEAFMDRGYADDGTLLPRGTPGAVLHDPERVAARALRMVRDGVVETQNAVRNIEPQTLCVHSDTPGAASLARGARAALEGAGVTVQAF
jgi:5-oxoprolinase (ATP-hydrolysing) subunit A